MKYKNLFWGVFFILAAVVIILNQTGVLIGVSLFNLIITILLIPIIISSIRHLNFSGILFPLAVIGILYADILGIQTFVPWPILGAALFLSIGLTLLFPKHKWYKGEKYYCSKHTTTESTDQTEDGEVSLETRFSESIRYIRSENLKRVNLDCSFGAMKVYFDNANIDGEEAVVNMDISFSGVEIYVPKEWKVVDNVNCMLGGTDEKNKCNIDGTKRLILKGRVSFGGLEIIYI